MNRALRRRREREDAHGLVEDLKKQIVGLTDAKAALLDIINALVVTGGGKVIVPMSALEGHNRRQVQVQAMPDDGHYVVTLEGYDPPPKDDVAKRMKERGLWLPGQDA